MLIAVCYTNIDSDDDDSNNSRHTRKELSVLSLCKQRRKIKETNMIKEQLFRLNKLEEEVK